jgi:MFS transporter, CP family, cyanate transporter
MNSPTTETSGTPPLGRFLTCVALLWLAGIGLRMTILAVPPVIPLIHNELHMSQTAVGIIAGLPAVLFACAAVPGSLLIARFGALTTLVIGLTATGIGSALRGAAPDLLVLYAATVVTGFGVAVMQPSLPPLVRAWLPHRIGFGTAVYTNGLLVGESIPVALTLPVVLPLVGGSWRLGFVVWGIPCLVFALVILAFAPRARNITVISPGPRRWWPDWHKGVIWRLGLMLGSVNAMYFSTNGFIPDYLHQTGQSDVIGPALTAINVGQLPASILLLFYAGRWVRQVWPYFACGAICLVSFAGILFGDASVIIASAALLGFAAAAILVFMLALPPLLSPADDVHRMTAGMFTISYSCAIVVPIISGLLWDMTSIAATAFIPIGLCAFLLMALAPTIRPQPEPRAVTVPE